MRCNGEGIKDELCTVLSTGAVMSENMMSENSCVSTFIKASASRTARVVRKKVLPGLGPATIAVSEFGFILRHRVVLALCTGGLDPPPVCVGGGVWVWHRRQASPSPPMGGGCGTGRWLRPVTIYSLFPAVP